MRKRIQLLFAFVAVALALRPGHLAARGADPTFAEEIAPILYKNCTACHHPSGIGPFSLLDYDSASMHTDEIRDMVSTGQMPPWQAEGPHGVFRNDRRLSEVDKNTIVRWIDAGANPGDMKNLPPRPDYSSKWSIGEPDLVVGMAEDFDVPASGTIEYQYFQVPTNLTEDKWVQAIEVMPGAREAVHHVLVFARVPSDSDSAPQSPFVRSAADVMPRQPRIDMRHPSPKVKGALIASMVPGTTAQEFPPGTALRLRAGTVLTLDIHYTAHGHEMNDRTNVGFKFASAKPNEEMFATHFVNGAFTIPANAKDVAVSSEIGATQPIRIWGLLPHTHLRGTRWRYTLERPDGTSDVILDMPHYDFNWQTYYMYSQPLEVPVGGRIRGIAWYDNSTSNKHNPDATKDVHWGDQTWEEMQYTGLLYSIAGKPPS